MFGVEDRENRIREENALRMFLKVFHEGAILTGELGVIR
jgi:hypothetical protein